QQDFAGKLEQKSKFNVGAIYRVTDWADVNLSYERGNTFMFGVIAPNVPARDVAGVCCAIGFALHCLYCFMGKMLRVSCLYPPHV
ncbi:YjbH domain-containing protein, partial [Salmonella enterica subsp. enterica serovar Kentucky]|nr:YjbH domain-containing protein [Salmonella enterica subsp. enterica serovar Kentucky]